MSTSDYSKTFKGLVVKRPFAIGSKSEHEAVCLVDSAGHSFKLRRVGGNPFADEQIERLVGKKISGKGKLVAGNTVVMSSWVELPDGDPKT